MTTATVIRPLAPSEEIFAPGEVYVGYCVRVSGRLELSALARAYELLLRAHPILGAHLEAADDRYVLLEPCGPAPEISVTEGDPELLLTGAVIDQRMALSTVCVVRDGDSASVTLVTHHCVADAYHSLALLRELWGYYRDIVLDRPIPIEVHDYPRPVEELLAARGIEKVSNPITVPRAMVSENVGAQRDWDSIGYVLPRATRCHLSTAETAELVAVGHREKVTINALVSAAILLTEAEIRNLPLPELIYTYSVDLRTRITPQVGYTDGTNILGFANYAPGPNTPATMLGLARDIYGNLCTELASGVVQQTPLHIPDISAAGPPRIPGIVLATNWGRIQEPPMPPSLRITDFRSTMIGKPDRTGRRPEKPDEGTCIITTFRGRLSIEIHHPESTTPQHVRRVKLLTAHLLSVLDSAQQ
ncbi:MULTISPECIES: hypothetical protein [unclassified Nocardia]|uniref:phthiocerol/phthiodiolone dimycocerosyl transferase family protein n=1 Tax=unclassified Nocardia TaxID=2637762 RepID=UPI001CE3EC0D|nr:MULTISPECIES: hypothetical protein [unclassified Nocardia]